MKETGRIFGIIGLALFTAPLGFTQSPSPSPAEESAPPFQVEAADVGPLVVSLGFSFHELQIAEEFPEVFNARFALSLTWNPQVDPDWSPEDLTFPNAVHAPRVQLIPAREVDAPGLKRVALLVHGTFKGWLDYRAFPLDEHELPIFVASPSEGSKALEFRADPGGLSVRTLSANRLDGWVVHGIGFRSGIDGFNHSAPATADGDIAAFGVFTVDVQRGVAHAFIRLLLPLLVIWLMAYAGFFWDGDSPASRCGSAAMFSAIAFSIGTRFMYPDVDYITLLNVAFTGLYINIGISFAFVTAIFYYRKRERPRAARLIWWTGALACPALIIVTILIGWQVGQLAETDTIFDYRPEVYRPIQEQ